MGPEVVACDHHWISHTKGLGYWVRVCQFCDGIDWDDLDAQVAPR